MVLVFTSAVSKFRVHEISFAFGWFPPADEIPRCSAFFSCLQFLQIQLNRSFQGQHVKWCYVHISCFKIQSAWNFFCVWMVSSSGWNSTLFCFLFLFTIPSDPVEPIFSRSTRQMVLCSYQLFQNSECAKVHLRLDGFLQCLVHWPNENKIADLAGRCVRRDLS